MTVGTTMAFCYANISYNEDGSTTDDYFNRFPPGYRFCPRDCELIEHYLMKKLLHQCLPHHRIRQITSVYELSPQHLTGMFKQYREKEWYFFTHANEGDEATMEYHNDINGYWKVIMVEPIIDQNGEAIIANKRSLDYYEKGMRTNWKMQQYHITSIPNIPRDSERNKEKYPGKPSYFSWLGLKILFDQWILCRIYTENNKIIETDKEEQADKEEEVDTDEEEDEAKDGAKKILTLNGPTYKKEKNMNENDEEKEEDEEEERKGSKN
ncbi:hypothetical protein SLEP1_g41174 [Rubroshorea leprosula]|uniref:NAC domain-containing protein n=1 Tax=Rubroshorea leprosula TaxID=152421 RepID=A0AAV5L627_9ROSI|nr:hypothetical protein SLEP1_g41174 [Rubroshorea leprosula]